MTGPTYEMLWDCSRCGTRKLLGKTHRYCPGCGAPQDDTARYFPSEDEKVAVADHVYCGADLVCAHCSTPNSRRASHCVNCGAPMGDDDAEAAAMADQVVGGEPHAEENPVAALIRQRKERQERNARIGLIVIIAVALLGGLGYVIKENWTRTSTLEVTGHSWERRIFVERFDRVSESAWCDAMPADARSVTRSRQQRSTRQVPDGQDCKMVNRSNADGTFRQERVCTPRYRSEPVYDDRCSYTVDRWVERRSVAASGQSLEDRPTWPEPTIRTCTTLGCEREGRRTAAYVVELVETSHDERPRHPCSTSEATWAGMAVGSTWTAEVRMVGGEVKCESLEGV